MSRKLSNPSPRVRILRSIERHGYYAVENRTGVDGWQTRELLRKMEAEGILKLQPPYAGSLLTYHLANPINTQAGEKA